MKPVGRVLRVIRCTRSSQKLQAEGCYQQKPSAPQRAGFLLIQGGLVNAWCSEAFVFWIANTSFRAECLMIGTFKKDCWVHLTDRTRQSAVDKKNKLHFNAEPA